MAFVVVSMLTVEGSVHQGECLHSLLNVFVLICSRLDSGPLVPPVFDDGRVFVFCALNRINLIPHKVRVCVRGGIKLHQIKLHQKKKTHILLQNDETQRRLFNEDFLLI